MTIKIVSQAVYDRAIRLSERLESIAESDLSEDMKLDFIFSEDIDWLQKNVGFQMTKRASAFVNGDIEIFLKRLHSAISKLETPRIEKRLHTEDIGNGLYT